MIKYRKKINIVPKINSFYTLEGGRLKSISCDNILSSKENNLCHYWRDVIPSEDTQSTSRVKELLDGFPMAVPHNRLIVISDMKKDVIDINLSSKTITEVKQRKQNSSGFSLIYDCGDKYIYLIGGFI